MCVVQVVRLQAPLLLAAGATLAVAEHGGAAVRLCLRLSGGSSIPGSEAELADALSLS